MAYFPFFMDIAGKRGVILGGGRIAAGKIAALLPFAPQLVCIAPVICGEIERMAASLPEGQGGAAADLPRGPESGSGGSFFRDRRDGQSGDECVGSRAVQGTGDSDQCGG